MAKDAWYFLSPRSRYFYDLVGNARWLKIKPGRLAAGAAGTAAATFAYQSFRSLRDPAPIWFEGPIIGFMQAIRAGRLYQMSALQSPPYSVMTHPPLAYYLGYLLYSAHPAFWPLRLLNIGATIGCALLIAKFVQRQTGDRRMAPFFAAAAFLVCTPVLIWSQMARSVDSVACFFSLCAILAAISLQPGVGRNAAVAVSIALAVLSKQTALLVLGLTLASHELLARRSLRAPLWWAAGSAALVMPVAAWLEWRTTGGFFLNVVVANLDRMDVHYWLQVNRHLAFFWPFFIAVLAVAKWDWGIAPIWLLVSCVFGLLTVAKIGSDMMYFFDTSAALAIVTGIAFAGLRESGELWRIGILSAGVLLLTSAWFPWRNLNSRRHESQYREMLAFVRKRAAPQRQILSEDANLPVQLGLTPLWDDPFVFKQLRLKGLWDDSLLIDGLRRRDYFAVVVGDKDFWPDEMLAELDKHYYPAEHFYAAPIVYTVHLPRPNDTDH